MKATLLASALIALPHGGALAQGRDQVPNQSANGSMINLILQMVKQGSVTPANGAILIQEALGSNAPAPQQAYATAYAPQPMPAYVQGPQQAMALQPVSKNGKAVLAPVRSIAQPVAAPQPVYAQAPQYAPQQQYAPQPQYAQQQPQYTQQQSQYAPQPQYAPQQVAQAAPPPAAYAPAPVYVAPQVAQAPVLVHVPQSAAPAPVQAYAPQPVASAPAPVQAPVLVHVPQPPAPAPVQAYAPQQVAQAAPVSQPAPVQPAPTPVPAPVTAPATPAAAPPVIRVSYVPEHVRKQIADEVRAEVMAQAKAEGWAAPGDASPEWVRRITLFGDMRVRSQSELFSAKNADDLLDYAAFNASSAGSDVTNVQNLAFLNTTQDRWNRARLRARLGVDAKISSSVEAVIQIATGDDNSPISTNQILAGGLNKRDLWLDRAFLRLRPNGWIDMTMGRMPNMFRSTELLFDDDVNFDGIVTQIHADKWLPKGMTLALRGGVFPLDFGSSNFPNTETDKRKYPSKWLFSGQIEAGFKPAENISVTAAAGYYDFRNVQGKLSASCPFNGVTVKNQAGNGTVAADPLECSTDGTRAFSPRKGNTLFFIRNLTTPDVNGVALERQYLGLTYKYQILDAHLGVSVNLNDSIKASWNGNYLRNIGFKRSDECRYGTTIGPFTNVKATSGIGNACAGQGFVQSGNEGWISSLSVGYDKPRKWGEWRAEAGYRYLQTDAVLDSLTDSDFHLGGTNAKGYTVSGTLGLLDGVRLTGKWLSANEVTGRPLSIDALQFDLQAEF